MKTIFIGLVVITLTTIKLSLQLFSDPDLTNPILPEQLRRECGYRYRPIFFPNKCLLQSKEQKVIIPRKLSSNGIPVSRVKDGRDVEYREAPWAVDITLPVHTKEGHFQGYITECSGSLLTPQHILTAAHCNGPNLNLFVGNDTVSRVDPITDFDVIIHPNYIQNNTKKLYNDIAIIRLHTPLNFKELNSKQIDVKYRNIFRVNTICLPQETDLDPPPNEPVDRFEPAVVYGWGIYQEINLPQKLQRGDMTLKYNYFPNISVERIRWFVSRETGIKSCRGDSGGGVVQYLDESETRAVLIGIIIASRNLTLLTNYRCNDENEAEIHVLRVAKHLNWIYEQIRGVEDVYH